MAKVTKRLFEKEEDNDKAVRINKFLSDAGVCSRREADMYIEKGQIRIDGEKAVMGSKVMPGQVVEFKGKVVSREEKLILIAFNKPQGIVCTTDQREPDNIIDYIDYGKRIYPIGRLDKDSEGLILLTNDGNIVNKILRAGNNHEKEYIVKVNKPITMKFLKGMTEGVPILDTITRPCKIEALDRTTFRIILTQGLNRQIRRMCEYFEYRVTSLQRVRIMNITIGHLQLGGYRNVTDKELAELKELTDSSSNVSTTGEIDDEFVDVRGEILHTRGAAKNKIVTKKMQKGRNFGKDAKKQSAGMKQGSLKSPIHGKSSTSSTTGSRSTGKTGGSTKGSTSTSTRSSGGIKGSTSTRSSGGTKGSTSTSTSTRSSGGFKGSTNSKRGSTTKSFFSSKK